MQKKTFNGQTPAAAELFGQTPGADQTGPQGQREPKPLIITWKARPDGERRDYRFTLNCKRSIAEKAAALAKSRGLSIANLFEQLISREYDAAQEQGQK